MQHRRVSQAERIENLLGQRTAERGFAVVSKLLSAACSKDDAILLCQETVVLQPSEWDVEERDGVLVLRKSARGEA